MTGRNAVDVRTRVSGPVIGCEDAFALAQFYATLLGWDVVDRSEKVPGAWALVRSPDRQNKLEFQREEPFVPPVWPTVAGEQQMGMHLDIAVDGLAPMSDMETRSKQFNEVVEQAVALGARVADHQPQPGRVLVILDPAGHPFCLFPGNAT
jgi:catechol 2,3-dioxygenase-like lactoylglutathione lyase family enzyme